MNISGTAEKSGPLKYTNNFVYNNADCLGKGATASVYLGRHREDGTAVAIKVFNNLPSRHIDKAKVREIELLKSVKHKNVMRLIAQETETTSGDDVIVMEYCQGGSVYSLLDQPQNSFGFPENEFLLFLRNITDALKYLRSHGFIHRDIKPGNIMKRIDEDGSTSYVVTDFGAARELAEEETFQSIYGTEEYIHPGMFQRAVLRQGGPQDFTSTVDQWSLAVTVFQVACGELPFKAHGGRNDAATLYKITSTRQLGVISGIQTEAGGPITWSKKLPSHCRLPRPLRQLLEPVLARMLDGVTYEQCFAAIDDLLNRRKVKLFCPQRGTRLYVYARPTDSLVHIQEQIAGDTDIPATNQLLLVPGSSELGEQVDAQAPLHSWEPTILEDHIVLLEKDANDRTSVSMPELPQFPEVKRDQRTTPNERLLANHAIEGKRCAAYAFYVESVTSEVIECQKLLVKSVKTLSDHIHHFVQPLETSLPHLETTTNHIRARLDCVQISQENLKISSSLLSVLDLPRVVTPKEQNRPTASLASKEAVDVFCSLDEGLAVILQRTNVRVNEINVYMSVLMEKLREQCNLGDLPLCHDDDKCLSKVENIRQKIQAVFATLVKHKRYGSLHPHEAFIHSAERRALQEHCGTLVSLLQGHCQHNLTQLHVRLHKQISILLKHKIRAGKVMNNVQCVIDCQKKMKEKLEQLDAQYQSASKLIQAVMREHLSQPRASCITSMERVEPKGAEDNACCSSEKHVQHEKDAGEKVKARTSEILKLMDGMTTLQTDTTKMLAPLVRSNTDALRSLKSLLDGTTSLNTNSFSPHASASPPDCDVNVVR